MIVVILLFLLSCSNTEQFWWTFVACGRPSYLFWWSAIFINKIPSTLYRSEMKNPLVPRQNGAHEDTSFNFQSLEQSSFSSFVIAWLLLFPSILFFSFCQKWSGVKAKPAMVDPTSTSAGVIHSSLFLLTGESWNTTEVTRISGNYFIFSLTVF